MEETEGLSNLITLTLATVIVPATIVPELAHRAHLTTLTKRIELSYHLGAWAIWPQKQMCF
jgi:hypothetical protein